MLPYPDRHSHCAPAPPSLPSSPPWCCPGTRRRSCTWTGATGRLGAAPGPPPWGRTPPQRWHPQRQQPGRQVVLRQQAAQVTAAWRWAAATWRRWSRMVRGSGGVGLGLLAGRGGGGQAEGVGQPLEGLSACCSPRHCHLVLMQRCHQQYACSPSLLHWHTDVQHLRVCGCMGLHHGIAQPICTHQSMLYHSY
jgi:hypothetical protein